MVEPRPTEVTNALSDLIKPVDGRDVDVWVGATRGSGGATRLLVSWDPTNRYGNSKPASAEVELLDEEGKPTGEAQRIETKANAGTSGVAVLDTLPGNRILRLTVKSGNGDIVDQWRERVQVPALNGELAMATPRFYRARTPFELRALEADPSPTPVASRAFRSTDRVLVELEVYTNSPVPAALTAELLNQDGRSLVTLPVPAAKEGKTRIALPLSSLARSTYVLRLHAKAGEHEARQLAPFQVVP
jgi:hypothetical protein